ncbi:MAG: hypothetical protein Q9169_006450 [Polycauliona sp. 2 TL-2023]
MTTAYSATIPPTNRLVPESQNLTAEFDVTNFHCVHSPEWRDIGKYFDISDCFGTLWMMQHVEGVNPFEPEIRREFKTCTAPSNLPPGDSVLTPRKYVVGTCTLAILMRAETRPGDLPAEEGRSTITNDVSSFKTIGRAAGMIWDMCGKRPLQSPGWATIGQRGAMAVAFWGTGSTVDKHYSNLRPVVALPSLPRPESLEETA